MRIIADNYRKLHVAKQSATAGVATPMASLNPIGETSGEQNTVFRYRDKKLAKSGQGSVTLIQIVLTSDSDVGVA